MNETLWNDVQALDEEVRKLMALQSKSYDPAREELIRTYDKRAVDLRFGRNK